VVLRVHTRVFRCFIRCNTYIFFPSFTYNVILFVNFCNCCKFCSAPPPPLQAATFSRSVVTMRCDISTSSSAHISLLVSGSAYVFPQLLENHIKKELTENSQLVQAIPSHEQNKLPSYEPRRSASVACGSSVFEVCMRVPTWASQVNCFFFLKVYVSWSRF
jgi:hypothetical protein